MPLHKARAAIAAGVPKLSKKAFAFVIAAVPVLNALPAQGFSDLPGAPQKGYVFVAGLMSGAKNYAPYLAATNASAEQIVFLQFDQSPFSANHVRDYAKMKESYEQLEAHSPGGIVLFGFSAGSKFAFRLAEDHASSARALFLLDPVDGGPPLFSNKTIFPDFIDDNSRELEIPTVFLETEFGPKPAMLGLSCVPAKKGPQHFAPHINPALLKRVFLAGAGHPDFLYPPVNPLTAIGCGKSQVNSETVRAQTLAAWKGFLGLL